MSAAPALPADSVTLGLLAGGRGSRLGGIDKAWLERDGVPQVLRLARRFPGETGPVLNDVRHAKQNGHRIVTFTRRSDSTLAQMSDIVFVVDGSRQTLAGSLPNTFFGRVILAFEELVAFYFEGNRP